MTRNGSEPTKRQRGRAGAPAVASSGAVATSPSGTGSMTSTAGADSGSSGRDRSSCSAMRLRVPVSTRERPMTRRPCSARSATPAVTARFPSHAPSSPATTATTSERPRRSETSQACRSPAYARNAASTQTGSSPSSTGTCVAKKRPSARNTLPSSRFIPAVRAPELHVRGQPSGAVAHRHPAEERRADVADPRRQADARGRHSPGGLAEVLVRQVVHRDDRVAERERQLRHHQEHERRPERRHGRQVERREGEPRPAEVRPCGHAAWRRAPRRGARAPPSSAAGARRPRRRRTHRSRAGTARASPGCRRRPRAGRRRASPT